MPHIWAGSMTPARTIVNRMILGGWASSTSKVFVVIFDSE
jgi:hypothetical protein